MPYYLTLSNASASPFDITSADGSPHLTREVRTRANTIWNWVARELRPLCPPHIVVRCEAKLTYLGYLAIRAEASHEQFQPYVDAVVDIARRASNGCCESCDNPGEPIPGEGWLTTLCKNCFEEGATDSASIHQVRGDDYDIAA